MTAETESLLFTGATGFLGSNILPALRASYRVTTLGRRPGADIRADLAVGSPQLPAQPFGCVLHAAGLAHRPEADARDFLDANLGGTRNLCRALERSALPRRMVFISTVAVYGCDEGSLIDESHPLDGRTPYAISKIRAEEYLAGWCARHRVGLTILRPPLIAGKNPPGNLGAMIRGIQRGFYFNIAGGHARKSMLMADDIARLIPLTDGHYGIFNVCDSRHPSFAELAALIAHQSGCRQPLSIPAPLAAAIGRMGDILKLPPPICSESLSKTTKTLTFSNLRATAILPWQPLDVLSTLRIS